jgi:cellulose synthase operon protein C
VSDSEQQLREKLSEAWSLPHGRAQIAVAEEVIRHADAQDLDQVQFEARLLATDAYTYGGEPAKAFVTFAWCRAAHDRGGVDHRYDHHFYWQFKAMISAMTKFPELSLEQTHAALEDMEERYRRAGHVLSPVHQRRTQIARHVGDVDTAEEQYRLWCATPGGEMSDCVGCEPTGKVDHLSWRRRDEDAVALAMPVLEGTLTCVEQPQSILTSLLSPYLRTGRLTEAAEAHRRAYRAMQGSLADMASIGDHVVFCARTGNHARGLDIVERHLGWLAHPPSPWADMEFSAAAALVARLIAEAGHEDVTVRRVAPGDDQAEDVTVTALHDELAERARVLAARFDKRNGTTEVGDRVAGTLATEPLTEHVPLSGWARRAAEPEPAPEPVELPADPAELVALARAEARLGNDAAVAEAWRRFDEVCPDPEPALLAHRLSYEATEAVATDPERAEEVLTRAAELFDETGQHVRALAARANIGRLWCVGERADEGLAQVLAVTEEVMATGDDTERIGAHIRLGLAYGSADRYDEALAAFRRAEDVAGRVGDATLAGEAALCLAHTYVTMGADHHASALEHVERAIASHASVGPSGNLRQAQFLAGQLHGAAGDLERAYEVMGEAARSTDPAVRGHALHIQGKAALDLDRDACDVLSAAAVAFGPESSHTAYVKLDLGVASMRTERPEQAADAVEEALPVLLRLGDNSEANRARFVLGDAYQELHQYEQAVTLYEQAAEQCAAEDNQAGVGQMLAKAADVLSKQDRDAEAAERYTSSAEAYESVEFSPEALTSRRQAALCWHWAGENDRSLAALGTAEDLAADLAADDDPPVVWQRTMLAYDGARVLADLGHLRDATGRARSAVSGFQSLDLPVEAAFASTLLGRLLADQGETKKAAKLLKAALRDLPEDAARPREQITELLEEIREPKS